jgi:hypothetical protein
MGRQHAILWCNLHGTTLQTALAKALLRWLRAQTPETAAGAVRATRNYVKLPTIPCTLHDPQNP